RVEDTLKRFRTDYIDVANMHGLAELKDVENMFSSGSLETLVKLKEEGVVRYIGFSSHSSPQASLEALKRFDFDVALMAANASKVPYVGEFEGIADGSFEDEAIPFAVEKGVGVFAFKVTGQRRLIRKNNETDKAPGHELLRYAWSLPVHGIVLGMHTREHVETAAEMCADFTPMPKDEMRRWNELLAPSANELTLDYLRPDYVDDGGWRAHLA
ncbi:MAG: aldo/keto reductase, partial [Gemmatimonadota bacterium]|nr:aldo/keto reductase [Gemmatimonadota bacterium]